MPLALLALALGAFGIGTTEFVIAGLLPDLAADFHTSIPTAGLLVSGYAFGVVAGRRWSPRSAPGSRARPCSSA
ncbi:hypothetical protein [Actinomadura sp. J1-007]|uniref:hypothetical protein n=1 Tax=Actinomadura sp. J1-007 TaxID=2661913 RepID=UPI001F4F3F1D|nr:hypothetical protein [Actinomadura sp. J1-007]